MSSFRKSVEFDIKFMHIWTIDAALFTVSVIYLIWAALEGYYINSLTALVFVWVYPLVLYSALWMLERVVRK